MEAQYKVGDVVDFFSWDYAKGKSPFPSKTKKGKITHVFCNSNFRTVWYDITIVENGKTHIYCIPESSIYGLTKENNNEKSND